jgi:hypothetical protein
MAGDLQQEDQVEESFYIQRWKDAGSMTPDGILHLMYENILYRFSDDEQAALRENFDSVCLVDPNGSKYWNESIFVEFLARLDLIDSEDVKFGNRDQTFQRFLELPGEIQDRVWFYALPDPLFSEVGPILYSTALNLGMFPFNTEEESPSFLTYEMFVRAVLWVHPERFDVMGAGAQFGGDGVARIVNRFRSSTDQRRLLFESLADCKGGVLEYDVNEAKRKATKVALDVMEDYADMAATNYDDDGDERYHDVVDVLAWTQPNDNPSFAIGPRDEFKKIAKDFHGSRPLLRQLSVPQDNFKKLVKLMLSQQLLAESQANRFIRPLELDRVADNILKAYTHSGPITWESFDEAHMQKTVRTYPSPLICTMLQSDFCGTLYQKADIPITALPLLAIPSLLHLVHRKTVYRTQDSVDSPTR